MVRTNSVDETGGVARTALAIVGGYVFASGASAMLAILLVSFGIPQAQVAEAAALSGIPTYLGAALWTYGDHELASAAMILLGGGIGLRLAAALLGYVI